MCWDVPKGQEDYPSGTACHLPFQGRLNNSSALSGISSRRGDLLRGKRHNNNINHLHKKYLESQHYKYRKRQTKAFASPRRTARNERIPPDGFRGLSLGQCFQKHRENDGRTMFAPTLEWVTYAISCALCLAMR